MKLLVIIICLLSERYLLHSLAYQRKRIFKEFFLRLEGWLSAIEVFKDNYWLSFAVAIFLPTIICFLLLLLLNNFIYGILIFIINIGILYLCLGPDFVFYPDIVKDDDTKADDPARNYLINVNSQLFSVLFWYAVGGPALALAYRLITEAKNYSSFQEQSLICQQYMEWVPARITGILYLLAGNVRKWSSALSQYFLSLPENNSNLLAECGTFNGQIYAEEKITIMQAIKLVDIALLIWLVTYALLMLISWI